ncbi:MAG: class I SAM-dependent methyltransferase [Parcubacteria group bacterium]
MKSVENIDYWEKTLQNPPKSFVKLFEQEKAYLRRNVEEDAKVLDIGCGNGRNILSIVDITENVTGLDIDEKAVEDTRANIAKYPKVEVILGDVTNMSFTDKTFDVVVFSMTLVNLDNQKSKALSELKRVAKDDAKIIISVYSEKATYERMIMYRQINLPIESEINGKFVFGIDVVSEQFSIGDIKKMIEPLDLEIDNYEEVEKLAYIFTLKKV